ncbi:hypothetical protein [Leclercia sp.]|nr:hypothetical protein [Leclercia sp.]
MDRTSPYYRQVALLVRTLPYVANESCICTVANYAPRWIASIPEIFTM